MLDIDKLRRDGLIRPQLYGSGSLTWTQKQSGREVGSIGFVAKIDDYGGLLRLQYTTTRYGGEKIESNYEVGLETVRQPFGGIRWYFTCPSTGARACKLYMPPGSTRFLSRGAYRRLAYRSQREAPHDRALSRAFELRRKLGDQGAIDDWIMKPKWMRWKTFERRTKRIKQVERIVNAHLAGFLDQLRSHSRSRT